MPLAVNERYFPRAAERVESVWIGALCRRRQASDRLLRKFLGSETIDAVDDDRSAIGDRAILRGAV